MTDLINQLLLENDFRQQSIDKMLSMTEWITADELQRRQNLDFISSKLLRETWIRHKQIFSVTNSDRQLFANFQFDEMGKPLQVIADTLNFLQLDDGWATAAWFLFPNAWVPHIAGTGCVAPVEVLAFPEKVISAAQFSRNTHFC